MATKLNLGTVKVGTINVMFSTVSANLPGLWFTFPEDTWKSIRTDLIDEFGELPKEEKAAMMDLYVKTVDKLYETEKEAADYVKRIYADRRTAAADLFKHQEVGDITDMIREDMAAIHSCRNGADLDAAIANRIGSFKLWFEAMGLDATNTLAVKKAMFGINDCCASLVTTKGEYKKGYGFQRTLVKAFCDWGCRIHKQMIKEDTGYAVKGH